MKYFLISVIKLYWKFIPSSKRRPCLFNETCSQFVYRKTSEAGFIEGIKAFSVRYKKCRNGYKLYTTLDGFEIELVDGNILKEDEISPNLLAPIYRKATEYFSKNSKV